MSKPAIPTVNTGDPELDHALRNVKQSLDSITGQGRNVTRLEPLPATATLDQVIAQLNAVVDRLQ
jgi:hypothetical protein